MRETFSAWLYGLVLCGNFCCISNCLICSTTIVYFAITQLNSHWEIAFFFEVQLFKLLVYN